MISFTVRMKFRADDRQRVAELLASLAQASRQEPGCVTYVPHAVDGEPDQPAQRDQQATVLGFAERGDAAQAADAVEPRFVAGRGGVEVRLDHAEHSARRQRVQHHRQIAWFENVQRQFAPRQQ